MNKDEVNQGLYVPQLEKDACGIGMIADLNGNKSNSIVADALTILENMEHRGACGCEENTGDGAGIMVQIPFEFLFSQCGFNDVIINSEKGTHGVGSLFLPKDESLKSKAISLMEDIIEIRGFKLRGYRDVPVNNSMIGQSALDTEPDIVQVIVSVHTGMPVEELDRQLYVLRNDITHRVYNAFPEIRDYFYFSSFSCRTIVYKGQLKATQLRSYYPDLSHPEFKSALALVHSRFSTNTIPKWKLAQPFRMIAHNGEINTIRANTNNWIAREVELKSDVLSEEDIHALKPICNDQLSDSGNFDKVLEYLVKAGRSMPHAMMMMIPEAWHEDQLADPFKRAFYNFHESLMEPWDGPASICFTNGNVIGATLDRNGLRPSRYVLTDENVLILASEVGVLPIEQKKIVYKGRLQPGKILIADLENKRITGDDELKSLITRNAEYSLWLKNNTIEVDQLSCYEHKFPLTESLSKNSYYLAQGFSKEEIDVVLKAMSEKGAEPIGSMGSDIPLPVFSTMAQHIANYFKQEFAQVTNPPIDPLRERVFMSLHTFLGPTIRINNSIESKAFQIKLKSPILSKQEYAKVIQFDHERWKVSRLDCSFSVDEKPGTLETAIKSICEDALTAVNQGATVLVLSNAHLEFEKASIPSLLICGAVHQYLISTGKRKDVSLLMEGADILETHHYATLLSFGADAVFPITAYHIVEDQFSGLVKDASYNYKKAVEKGLLKIMSKLGISTISSYKGAQTFEAVGIANDVIELCFKNTVSRIGGMTLDDLAKEQLIKHRIAFNHEITDLPDLGNYQWKGNGEYHLFNPETIHLLQYSTRRGDYNLFKKFSAAIKNGSEKACTIRSFFDFKKGKESIPIDQVEPVERIFSRFATGAMSFGSISYEAHTTLAKAMNKIGGKSNSGEGGEDEIRYKPDENGDNLMSAIKQVASGRFGVTINYLAHAKEIQIKMAQGAKPGEGGHLPGHKVNDWIAKVRHSTPGVGLISPPPHHDIYSIEDLAQLIYDLKNANPEARISVKLVSKAGVGIIASGVAKAHADHILISGADGGTGASPLSSIRHAGLPWELGLAETHQTLVKNKLRDRVVIQADGQIRTGRDLAIATLLGAEEWGIATAALVVEGCIMMRKCHLNTCPVGIATQDPDLRKKYEGKVEHLVNYFTFMAMELREIMASLGIRTVDEMIGRSDLLRKRDGLDHWKWQNIDFEKIFYRPKNEEGQTLYCSREQEHGLEEVLDRKLIKYASLAIRDNININSVFEVQSTDRAVGTMLSHNIVKEYGGEGMGEDAISFRFRGSAGQSFGAFAVSGLKMTLEGDANDYIGKGLSGGKIIVVPDRDAQIQPSENIIIGNVALYGATSGKIFIRGQAGDRFCVRNSGAIAVVEGTGDNACEYMTGGRVVILGDVGRNFAAGMSGGIAWIYHPSDNFFKTYNREMVVTEDCPPEDLVEIRSHVREHFSLTGSITALEILSNWEEASKFFLRVIPTEYKAILEKSQKVYNGIGSESKVYKK
ncbi:MAG: glutamate synthase large subunit [Saprospiraceae bacterium]|nr:glutamate synthase large subunit [Saprospiraceae bacterium]